MISVLHLRWLRPASRPIAHLEFARQGSELLHLLHERVGRIDSLELAGEPERIQSSFVVGLKKLPLRYRVSQAA